MADAEPPDDEGHSPPGEPAQAETPVTSEAGMAPAEAPPGNPLEQRARLAEDRLAEVMAAYRTLKKENEDVRERQSRNLERRFDQRRERLLLKFIDVLDNLDRALEAAQTSFAGQPLVEGMILVRTQLLQTLQDEGLDRIPVVGLAFDPAVSESVSTAPVTEPEQHHIVVTEAEAPAPPVAATPSPVTEFDPATAETAPIPAPPVPAPIPPKAPASPRRKGR